jgi:tight adherence protein C
MIAILAATFTFLAVLPAAIWALAIVSRPADARLRSLGAGRQDGRSLEAIPFGERVIAPAIDGLGRRLAAMLPGALVRRTEKRLVLSGRPMEIASFFTVVAGMSGVFAAVYLLAVFALTGGSPPALAVMAFALFALVGAMLPMFWLSRQARARQRVILRSLPDSLDLLTITVEAGLGLEGAFKQLVDKQDGPLADELRQMLREVGVGKTRRQALLDLADRIDVDDARSFINAVIQSDELGTSLANVLRVQSQTLRTRQRQRVEQEARRAPVKMVFPLVFCLMPSLFIFILGPIIVSVMEFLSG